MNEPEAEYLEIYLEDTDQQIDALSKALVAWQHSPSSEACRKEVLRLLHAMEGAAGAMGFENMRTLTQHLNWQIDRIRPTDDRIDPSTIARLLRGLEFLGGCNHQLRAGGPLDGSAELLEQFKAAMDRHIAE